MILLNDRLSLVPLHVVVLAAGQGTRMRSSVPKVLHKIGGRTLLDRVLDCAEALGPASIAVVVGHKAEVVEAAVKERGHRVVLQAEQRGTAHALRQAEGGLRGNSGTLLLLSGDVPLLKVHSLVALLEAHQGAGAAATVLSAVVDKPRGYGRVVRDGGTITSIVEERDATPALREIKEINAGIYAFALPGLWDGLREIGSRNSQGEFYLTDLIGVFRGKGQAVEVVPVDDSVSVRGINTRSELAEAGAVMREQKNRDLMASGVTLIDPATAYIDPEVEIGEDTILHPGVILEGSTRIGRGCEIQGYVRLRNVVIGDRVAIGNFSVLSDCTVGSDAQVGPCAHIRPGTAVGSHGKVGNFVELKKTTLGEGSKVNHLSYLGDAQVGAGVNIGAGTITCNYDGHNKHVTVIADGAFIGSGSQLVAPVTVGEGAYVAAGSAITDDVPPASLGVARARQRNVDRWADRARPGKD